MNCSQLCAEVVKRQFRDVQCVFSSTKADRERWIEEFEKVDKTWTLTNVTILEY